MNYIGSKRGLLSFIADSILEVAGDVRGLTLAEPFAGTGAVSRYFKRAVGRIIVGDMEAYSYVLNRNYIGNNAPLEVSDVLAELNGLKGVEGFIYKNYCLGGGRGRQYFSNDNGRKIDAVRQAIERRRIEGELGEDEYYFLLASLLESADRVANVASVYGAFLKRLKRSAQKPFVLRPATFERGDCEVEVHQMDANELVAQIEGDLLYLDPPYNQRQYGANYHLLNTIALYDLFVPAGKTGLRPYKRSAYCSKGRAAIHLEDLIRRARFRCIFLSYNNEGLIPAARIKAIMSRYGDYSLKVTPRRRFKADSNRWYRAKETTEYLHILVKGGF